MWDIGPSCLPTTAEGRGAGGADTFATYMVTEADRVPGKAIWGVKGRSAFSWRVLAIVIVLVVFEAVAEKLKGGVSVFGVFFFFRRLKLSKPQSQAVLQPPGYQAQTTLGSKWTDGLHGKTLNMLGPPTFSSAATLTDPPCQLSC